MGDMLARWLYDKMERMNKQPKNILYNRLVHEDLRTLEPAKNTAKGQKEYVIGKLSLCIMVAIAGVVLGIITWISESSEKNIVDNKIYRTEYGEGVQQIELVAENGEDKKLITLEISERVYTKEQINEFMVKFLPQLETVILGQNKSPDRIEYDLELVNHIDGYPFEIEWLVDETYLDYSGGLVQDVINEPFITELTAKISYEDFYTEHVICCQIYSKALQPQWHESVYSQINQSELSDREKEYIELPNENGTKQLKWSYKGSNKGVLYLMVTPIIVIILFCGKDKDLHKQVELREEQMRMDYPELVSSLALLIGAGMTVPNAWNKVARDYETKKQHTGEKRYAYEEMLLTVYEMESGIAQAKAYENFGRRCRISSYNKLATMLSQNLRKGAVHLPSLLREEAFEAFNDRKHIARKLGEKAGTKLLGPMMLLLVMVMVIIILPVFMQL